MKKIKDVILYQDDMYNTFPSITADSEGTLYLVFRRAPHRVPYNHLDKDAVNYIIRSTDGGESWSAPKALYAPVHFGMQDPCITALKSGSLLVTTYFWKFMEWYDAPLYEQVLPCQSLYYKLDGGGLAYSDGTYAFISADKGESFDGPFCIEKGYVLRGQCVELAGGPLLAPIDTTLESDPKSRVALYASYDGGRVWEPYAHVWRDMNGQLDAHEPTLFLSASGDLYCFIRTREYMCYCKSTNGGKTWTQPVHTDILSHVPYHALALKDGRVLLTYARRHEPYGIRALLLDERMNGIASENEFVLRGDGLGRDIGYNSAVQLPNGEVLAVYYYYTKENDERRHIAGTWLSV